MVSFEDTALPPAYCGPLTLSQISVGINLAIENAHNLLDDAYFLLEDRSWSTAAALAVLAIEEHGKGAILFEFALVKTDSDAKRLWKKFRSHRAKNFSWVFPAMISSGARTIDDLAPAMEISGKHTALAEIIKQKAFYVDCFGDGKWSEPSHTIDEKFARALITAADKVVGPTKKTITVRELELWVEHMSPVIDKPVTWKKTALINWHKAMKDEGFEGPELDQIERFVRDRK